MPSPMEREAVEGSDDDLAIELQELLALTNNDHNTSLSPTKSNHPSPVAWQRLFAYGTNLQRRRVGCSTMLFLMMMMMMMLLLLILLWHNSQRSSTLPTSVEVLFQCPSPEKISAAVSKNTDDELFFQDYLDPDRQPLFAGNSKDDEFLATFRHSTFDARAHDFASFEEGIREWKVQAFAPYLQSGDSLYESACGIGLNLFATLEILQQEADITNLTVYGNEYVAENAERANHVLDLLLRNTSDDDDKNHRGVICQADSTDLSHVPDNSFDLVFSGYISPLWDPLELNLGFDENYEKMSELCEDEDHEDLVEEMQRRQEEWYSKWILEMIRIAKPGAPIVVEEVSLPYCRDYDDWGGVTKRFWKTGATTYGWNVDPRATFFGSHAVESEWRYNVFLQKAG